MGRKKKEKEGPSGPPGAPEWVVTFTDMISLLVTFFVLLMTFSSLEVYDALKIASFLPGQSGIRENVGHTAAEIQEDLLSATDLMRGAQSPHARPPEELADNLEEMGQKATPEHLQMDLADVADGLIIEFDQRGAFLPGSAEVNTYLAKSLGEIARVLQHYPYLIVLEGFTDGAFRSTPTFPTADELAFARGAAAARVMLSQSELAPELVQIASYGDRKPRRYEASAKDRQANRRVQIRVLSMSRARANYLETQRQERLKGGSNG